MKTVLAFSGGLDSTVLLHELRRAGDEVLALSVDYGQRHRVELDYAARTTNQFRVEWQVADLSSITSLIAGSSQTSRDVLVPHGHYAEESMKQTVVPNRNMMMLAVAGGWAVSRKADRVAFAAHAGDHTIYPDCRPTFTKPLGEALRAADWHRVDLYCPYLSLSKAGIVARGAELGVDFTSAWSCYEGREVHCGRCGTCFERREAFCLAGVEDPTTYEAFGSGRKEATPRSAAVARHV